ncbi:MAG TPA: pyridoxamine 5'-phosphate oxidase [Verrucomicrobiae bacterium]|nr:pyridoxamine 5'-phosphate oxidase [Verrucomicrobiae bacterium]
MAIADLRREYNLAGLRRKDLAADPLQQFQHWFAQASGARTSGVIRKFLVNTYKTLLGLSVREQMDVNAMTLATADQSGRPSARTVLLKGVDPRGFIFFTNYNSRKGHELGENSAAALVFYWPEQERQVCVAGTVAKVSAEESDAYFQSRPHGSRIAAWASEQSAPVADRAALEVRWAKLQAQYPGERVPRPPHWGGFLLTPARVEFWQGRPNRMHDRFCYTRQPDQTWKIERLAP